MIFAEKAKKAFDIAAEKDELRDRYGRNTFGQSCLLARRLVEHGVRLVTVNMFDTVFNEITWDCHADGGSLAVTLDDYKETLCPMFDTGLHRPARRPEAARHARQHAGAWRWASSAGRRS